MSLTASTWMSRSARKESLNQAAIRFSQSQTEEEEREEFEREELNQRSDQLIVPTQRVNHTANASSTSINHFLPTYDDASKSATPISVTADELEHKYDLVNQIDEKDEANTESVTTGINYSSSELMMRQQLMTLADPNITDEEEEEEDEEMADADELHGNGDRKMVNQQASNSFQGLPPTITRIDEVEAVEKATTQQTPAAIMNHRSHHPMNHTLTSPINNQITDSVNMKDVMTDEPSVSEEEGDPISPTQPSTDDVPHISATVTQKDDASMSIQLHPLMTISDQFNQLTTSAQAIEPAVIQSMLSDPIPSDTSAIASLNHISQRMIESTWSNSIEERKVSEPAQPLPLPIPLMIAHILDECVQTPSVSRSSSAGDSSGTQFRSTPSVSPLHDTSAELLVGVGKKLGDQLTQGASLLNVNDLQLSIHSIDQAIIRHILSSQEDLLVGRQVNNFLKSLGYACPPFMLYCLLHLLDELIQNFHYDGDAKFESDGVSLSVLDWLENSCKLCHMIELMFVHPASSIATIPSTSISSNSPSSASFQVCQTQLRCFGFDWRGTWSTRFESIHLRARSLAVLHPMLFTFLKRILSRMNKSMQIQTIEQLVTTTELNNMPTTSNTNQEEKSQT